MIFWNAIKWDKMCRNGHILIGSLGDNDALTVSNSNYNINTFIIYELHWNKMLSFFFKFLYVFFLNILKAHMVCALSIMWLIKFRLNVVLIFKKYKKSERSVNVDLVCHIFHRQNLLFFMWIAVVLLINHFVG